MFSLLQFGHICRVRVVSIIALHKGFGIVHDVFIWRFLEAEDLHRAEVRVFRFLNKLELVFEVLPFLN